MVINKRTGDGLCFKTDDGSYFKNSKDCADQLYILS